MNTISSLALIPQSPEALPKVLSSTVRVRFQDCDPYGHLNNAAYLNVLINAREDQLVEQYEWDLYAYSAQQGSAWVVGKHDIIYRQPAVMNEIVQVRTRVVKQAEKNLVVEMAMLDQKGKALKAVMWTTFVHVNMKSGRPVPHQPELQDFLKVVEAPLTVADLFDRAKGLELTLLKDEN